ncbi:hypothetical protein AUJ14_03050 [Candidatus Micrarchaeota archaeon CG1_02_55_22]|nr:MAG: hypothetical protein AUJ14_03050 [Candidatus Micrarchaeota archaeon CG1_02_55_22]
MQFKLVSDFSPTGDQPQAIAALTTGIAAKKRQTLLGVTGSGKSTTGDATVLVRKNGVILKQPIGAIIDGLLNKHAHEIQLSNGTEILEASALLPTMRYEAYSLDPEGKKSSWKPILQFVRHSSPPHLLKVNTRCGRSVTVTSDHNFFVLRNSELTLTTTAELRKGDLLPVPRTLPEPEQPLPPIRLQDWLGENTQAYMAVPKADELRQSNKELLEKAIGRAKSYHVVFKQERISLEQYAHAIEILPALCTGARIGSKRKTLQFAPSQELSPAFLRLLGYYVAEGHAEKQYFIISSRDTEIASDFSSAIDLLGLTSRLRPETYDYQTNSTIWSTILARMCGKRAQTKQLPPFWPQLSNEQLRHVLAAYFSSDGGVNGTTISCATASPTLAEDIMLALLRFGIVARLRERSIKLPHKEVRQTYWEIHVSGQPFLRQFEHSIGFTLARKREALQKILHKQENTNVDLIPLGSRLRTLRGTLGLTQYQVATDTHTSRSCISLVESDKRRPSKSLFESIINTLRAHAETQQLHAVCEEVDRLSALRHVFWTPVKSIREVTAERYVYDFAVADNETFLAGRGGLFVHNTFTIANAIAQSGKNTLVLSHNKTLAAQLYSEFKEFFPDNNVEYFVSYYDYYLPESYLPSTDQYIEKTAMVNEKIEQMRFSTTASLMSGEPTIVVASVSAIYGLGSPKDYAELSLDISTGMKTRRIDLLAKLASIQYERNDTAPGPGDFRSRGNVIDVHPPYRKQYYRIVLTDDAIDSITLTSTENNKPLGKRAELRIFPARHFVVPQERVKDAVKGIRAELRKRLPELGEMESYRLKTRINYDAEMIENTGFCKGVENYSRYFDGRKEGERPFCLLDFFSDDDLIVIDESHVTLPQLHGMYKGDYARKKNLIDYGFRLPSAFDNRPLKYDEFEEILLKRPGVFVSATPGEYEKNISAKVVEQLVRPTGITDPEVIVRPTNGVVDDLLNEVGATAKAGMRTLVTTLTKRQAEDLTEYLLKHGIKARYLHSEIDALERTDIIRRLRLGEFDCLVGINLLREGLDLPEVGLVAVLDADKEGFLRNATSLIQTVGRACRNASSRAILYAETRTKSIDAALSEMTRRRAYQKAYNTRHGITPATIIKKVAGGKEEPTTVRAAPRRKLIEIESAMMRAAESLDFERAIELREELARYRRATKDKKSGRK